MSFLDFERMVHQHAQRSGYNVRQATGLGSNAQGLQQKLLSKLAESLASKGKSPGRQGSVGHHGSSTHFVVILATLLA
ncbi:hypothetical protein WJX82_006480 [Trebouxia sp. C0006]